MPSLANPSMWAGIIANPAAGRGRGRQNVEKLQAAFHARGVQVDCALTPQERHRIIKEALTLPFDRKWIVAIGGDGTVNALVNECPDIAFCNFASGTENLFARAFHTPNQPELLVDWVIKANTRRMDVGEFREIGSDPATSRRFALMLGFGFDAAVVNRHHSQRLSRTGLARPTSRLAYVGPLAYEAWNYKFPPVRFSWTNDEGKSCEQIGSTSIIFNMNCYAIGLKFVPESTAFDHYLDTIAFARSGSVQAGVYMATVAAGLHPRLRSVSKGRMRELNVEALEAPVPVQMDGDPAGWILPGKPWSIKCLPESCPILIHPDRTNREPGR
ncbi:MAG: diacylglycerol kinase [Planctomycetota bacterium]|nr:MAG: diacylglycerol kinase [Planctomycetota bacterium]